MKLHTLKFVDLVDPKTIQKLSETRESNYKLRGVCMLKKTGERTNIKSRCITVKGVSIWISCDDKFKNV